MQVQGIEDSVMVVEVVFPSQFSACCASLFGSVVLVEDLMEEVPQQHLSWWVSAALFDLAVCCSSVEGTDSELDPLHHSIWLALFRNTCVSGSLLNCIHKGAYLNNAIPY